MDNTEIEIRVRIESSDSLIDFLEKNAKFVSKEHQKDEYFTPAHRNFIKVRPVKEWLRLRSSSNKFSITYKNWHYDKDGKSHHCDEYQTEIQKLDQFNKILSVLNFKSLVVVDKTRKIWTYKDYEISLDSIQDLGDFVEIEYIGKSQNVEPREITKKMISFLKKLKCGKIERDFVGYPFQLLFPSKVKYEKQ